MAGRVILAIGLLMVAGCDDRNDVATPPGGAAIRLDGAGPLPGGSPPIFSDRIDVSGGRGVYTANRGGTLTRIVFPIDPNRVDPKRGHMFAPVGETAAGVVVLVDDYATATAAGTSRCMGGTETFVRVFSLPRARQLAALPAGSCLDGVPRPAREATWLAPDRFRLEIPPARTFAIDGVNGISAVKVD